MARAFGRSPRLRQAPTHVLSECAPDFTGAVVISASGDRGCIYLLNGEIYAAEVEGFSPLPIQRLVTSGALNAAEATELLTQDHPTETAVQQGFVSIDELATVHQEFVLACVGAILAAKDAIAQFVAGTLTDQVCTIPLPITDVLAAIEVRERRLNETWARVTASCAPDDAVFGAVSDSCLPAGSLPELPALAGAFNGRDSLDVVAGQLGLTRAEGVHLVAMLLESTATQLLPGCDLGQQNELPVPEAFGQAQRVDERT